MVSPGRALLFILLLAGAVPGRTQDRFLLKHDGANRFLLPCYGWTCGCSPTAASMAVGYWDHYGLDGVSRGKYVQWGRINDYYIDETNLESLPSAVGGGPYDWLYSSILPSRPRVLYDLAIRMQTDSRDGSTYYSDIPVGLEDVLEDKGYASAGGKHVDGTSLNDYAWDALTEAIDSNAPVVWSASGMDSGHSVCAWGYTDDQEVILYSTWGPLREDWYYRYYCGDPDDPVIITAVDPVKPSDNGTTTDDVLLLSPNGGQTWNPGGTYDILWQQFGPGIGSVSLEESPDGGKTWISITADATSVEGVNAYAWTVPSGHATTSRARVRIRGYGSSILRASDGSRLNFTIGPGGVGSTPTPYPTAHGVVIGTPTPVPTPTWVPVSALPEPMAPYLYPQPASGEAWAVYTLAASSVVRIEVFSFSGRRVKVFQDGPLPAGRCRTRLDLSSMGPGLYLYVISVESAAGKNERIGRGKFIVREGI